MPATNDLAAWMKERKIAYGSEAKSLLKSRGVKKPRQLLSYAVKKGVLYKAMNDFYTIRKDEILASYSFFPFYFSLQTAMSLRNLPLWTQETHSNICTVERVRRSEVHLYGKRSGYRLFAHHLPRKYFFGYSLVQSKAYGRLPVAEPEKILIDFVYLQILESRQVYEILAGGISARRLRDYLKPYDKRTQASTMKIYKENKGSKSKDLYY